MKLFQIANYNTKKLKKYKKKALFLILPLSLMITVTTVVTNHTSNVKTALDKVVFGTIAEQSKLIELTKDFGTSNVGGGRAVFSFNSDDSSFTETDLEVIKNTENVEAASINSSVPISNATTDSLFDGKSVGINSLYTLDSNLASLFTSEDFSYTEGEVIPIILNANSFNESYEDWQGKDEITIDFPARGSGPIKIDMNNNPVKTAAIEYDKSSLIGKEFEISFGGLDEIQDFTNEFTSTGTVFKKLTTEELNAKIEARKSTISAYWDYDKLNTPLKYKFKIVGVIEDESSFENYIPQAFAEKLMKDYYQNQLDARNSTAISTDDLGSKFLGTNFDGVEIQNNAFPGGARMIRFGGPGAVSNQDQDEDTEQYNIPGLVLKTERSGNTNQFLMGGSATVEGEYKSSDAYELSAKSGTKIIIKVNNFYNRTSVVKALNEKGYAYQDLYKSDVFSGLQSNIENVSKGLVVFFIAFNTILIVITMSKFVSESKKEIGILRAMGAKKSDIRNMFMGQALIYSIIALIVGLALGVGTTFLTSSLVKSWFDSEIGGAIKDSFNITSKADANTFLRLDLVSIGIFALILIGVTLVISYIPARKAAGLKPVEAIRKE